MSDKIFTRPVIFWPTFGGQVLILTPEYFDPWMYPDQIRIKVFIGPTSLVKFSLLLVNRKTAACVGCLGSNSGLKFYLSLPQVPGASIWHRCSSLFGSHLVLMAVEAPHELLVGKPITQRYGCVQQNNQNIVDHSMEPLQLEYLFFYFMYCT